MNKLILVSKSPRRSFLLKQAGLDFIISPSNAKEKDMDVFDDEVLMEISREKVYSIKDTCPPDSILISADTMVVLNNQCLKKPKDKKEAFEMLQKLSGNVHCVYTSITVFNNKTQKELTKVLETKVYFRKLSGSEIENYIEVFNPLDKAGSYGIQDFIKEDEINNPPKESFIQKIEGDYENVMGISTKLLKEMLSNF